MDLMLCLLYTVDTMNGNLNEFMKLSAENTLGMIENFSFFSVKTSALVVSFG